MVGWFGAFQGQDYGPASWGIGQRMVPGATQAAIDAAFDAGRILRTHAMRPTWHFLRPEDIRWILRLTSPRVHRLNALYYRRLELDGPTLARGTDVIVRALEGGRHRTRRDLATVLAAEGIQAAGQRLAYLIMHAELEAILVSGPRQGAQFTYALLEERVPTQPPGDGAWALAELTRRYFASHGPAEPRDFAWWSGLRISDAREGLALAGAALVREVTDGREYWAAPGDGIGSEARRLSTARLHLLPSLDEYGLSYRDRSPMLDPALLGRPAIDDFYLHAIARDGMLIGAWRRDREGSEVVVRTDLHVALDREEAAALESAAADYGQFIGTPVRVTPRER